MSIAEYWMKNEKVGEFGITYLDDNLCGILRTDLILIGARTGAGKSTLAELIALHNAKKGYKVHLFSLENFEGDVYATRVYNAYRYITKNYNLKQRDFACGNFEKDIDALVKAEEVAKKDFENVIISSGDTKYDTARIVDEIVKTVNENQTKLIILDHIDYIDTEGLDTNQEMTKLMSKIREIQKQFKVGIVAFSHLRKPVNKELYAIPSIDEFIGSSNKVKQATAVVLVSPDDKSNETNYDSFKKATWFCIRKLRMGGISNTCARILFDKRVNAYDDKYEQCVVNYNGSKIDVIG